ncbi:MAG: CRISPR-associated endonuclease Cas2 [Lachnospiraceae bacterium]|nr:CRISPR-associated endonuclease Cas2 [Lachnospiraceae bacterium]
MENYFFDTKNDDVTKDKVYVLIIYDIVDNRRRVKLAKFLQGYGFRIQKSAFEAIITRKKYQKLISEISKYVSNEDSVKVYKIIGKGQVTSFGQNIEVPDEDVILI